MKFTYRSGQQPLAGYTIKRGVGQGGFGEVYFAVSDGGKEVALKLLRGRTDTEMRGTAACLNLKHPNLVHVYDLKTDDRGDTWLVMEYVLGDSLSKLLHRHPNGLPPQMARDWFVTLCRAVGYLHDNGVLHRDIKPGNIFVENGTVKVGDYGLCKALGSVSERHSAWVGTAHYMAPEVGKGQYGRSIDVYACAVVLYEMLTGRPPFDGESEHEIMMRHATDEVDLKPVPPAFRAVLAKGLAKNPIDRYAGVTEFARAVDSIPLGGAPAGAPSVVAPVKPPAFDGPASPAPTGLPVAAPILKASPAPKPVPPPAMVRVPAETVPLTERLGSLSAAVGKAPIVAAIALVPWIAFSQNTAWAEVGKVYLVSVAASWGILLGSFGAQYKIKDEWGRRFRLALLGTVVGLFSFWLDGQHMPEIDPSGEETVKAETYLFGMVRLAPGTLAVLAGYSLYFAATLGMVRWWQTAARDRKERFSVWPLFVGLFAGLIFQFLWPHNNGEHGRMVFGVVPLVVAAAAVQIVSPWYPPETVAVKRKQRLQVA
ncbi:MAG TPA: serine/threonine-protein kinase [Fimbriiglobus sp.]|jgi:hypothetical protein